MSHLIPATSLKAWYDLPNRNVLHVRAEGEIAGHIFDIKFERLPAAGGFILALYGRDGIGPAVIKPYTHVQHYNVRLPNIVLPSKSIIIKTENNPHGAVVPIEYTNGPPPKDEDSSDSKVAESAETSTADVLADGNEEDRTVFLYNEFTLSASANVGLTGKVKLDYDSSKIQLTNAEIVLGKIVYTFKAQQLGQSPVNILEAHQNPPYVYEVVYNIDVVLPFGPGIAKAPGGSSTGNAESSLEGGAVESHYFLLIDLGFAWVKKEYPDAELYQVDSTPIHTVPVHNPNELGNLLLTFLAKNGNGDWGNVVTSSIGSGQFTPPLFTPIAERKLGIDPISWPLKGDALDIVDADRKLKEVGWDQDYFKVTLDTPVVENIQPRYFFNLWAPHKGDVTVVSVGAYDGKVEPLPYSTQKE